MADANLPSDLRVQLSSRLFQQIADIGFENWSCGFVSGKKMTKYRKA